MPDLLALVSRFVTRTNMIAPGQRLGVAVSGGADSVCLLHVLEELAEEWKLGLHVLHVDHQLRGAESQEDASFVAALAGRLRLPFTGFKADLEQAGDNLEQAAREARRTFFAEARERFQLDAVALGHTSSDQAETVLFRFLRGSGQAGLSGMRAITPDRRIRPLLERSREEVLHYLKDRGISWREDSSNRSPAFARNRIRHSLLPQLMSDWNPALPELLCKTALLAQAEEDYWEKTISGLAGRILNLRPDQALIPVDELTKLDLAVARRLLRWTFAYVKGDLKQIEYSHIDTALLLACQPEGSGRFQAPGLDIFRSFDWIRISPPSSGGTDRFFEIPVPGPGLYRLPGGARILLETGELPPAAERQYTSTETLIDLESCPPPLLLRSWRPGDQLDLPLRSCKKLKLLFQEARIPLWERRFWPILVNGDRIVWCRQFGVAEPCGVKAGTVQVWRVREVEESTAK